MDKLLKLIAGARRLPSERDQNFLLTDDSGQQFVLKVANTAESRSFLEAQNAVLNYLSGRVSFCQRVIGEIIEFEGHLVRLVTYLPGVPLAEIKPHTPGLLQDLGRKLGQLSRALADFDHPGVHRDFYWDLANGNRIVTEYAPLIEDIELRELILKCRFEPAIELRRSVIHGDANDYNVIVDPQSMTVSGLIDFGDMVYSYTVGDLAIAVASGANAAFGDEVWRGVNVGDGGAFLASFEVGDEAIVAGARAAATSGVPVVINPAPARELSAALMATRRHFRGSGPAFA